MQVLRSVLVFTIIAALAAPGASALPTPGLNGEATEPVFERLFPEALETNDYISYNEAWASLQVLNERHPERIEIVELGDSVGWMNAATRAHDTSKIYAVEVTNEDSALPADRKLNIAFLIAVHANEKGAREGALRIIEDFAADKGLAAEEPELAHLLDYQRLVFVFSNPDGWTHEELEYRSNDACYLSPGCIAEVTQAGDQVGTESQNFVRVNGNGVDLNRQYPTVGYLDTARSWMTFSEPEVYNAVTYLKGLGKIAAAADVHGMLNNDNFFRILLKDGAKTQYDFAEHERLAESLKQRLNNNPHYVAYQDGPKIAGAWGGDFAEWAATFDAIGYSASGTGGAFVTQHLGLGAPGFTIEQAYSHITVDNYYPGAGAALNDLHVESMRDTVAAFMEFVRDEGAAKVAGNDVRVAVLATDVVVANEDDDKGAYKGWFMETDRDDAFDIAHRTFSVSLNDYFTDLAGFLTGGQVQLIPSVADFRASLASHDTAVVPGSAAAKLVNDADALAALKVWVENGGRLVLTDEALSILAAEGFGAFGKNDVDSRDSYSGYTDLLTRDDPLTKRLKGAPRVTYDANPLGFGAGESPVWFVHAEAWNAAGGDAIGAITLQPPPLFEPSLVDGAGHEHGSGLQDERVSEAAPGTGVNVGRLAMGEGQVYVFGAVLPDAVERHNHPYGLAGYATSITGNHILLAMMGLTNELSTDPLSLAELLEDPLTPAGLDATAQIPAAGLAGAVAAVALALAARRRRA